MLRRQPKHPLIEEGILFVAFADPVFDQLIRGFFALAQDDVISASQLHQILFRSNAKLLAERSNVMTRVCVANLRGNFIHFVFTGIQLDSGMIKLVIQQVAVYRIAINFFEANLELKLVQSGKLGKRL